MNKCIEIHDSNVSAIEFRDGLVIVHFQSVYIHKSINRPGIDAGTVWIQQAYLLFYQGKVEGNVPNYPCTVCSGELFVGSQLYENTFPVPLESYEAAKLQLVFPNSCAISIQGTGVRLKLLGEASYLEDFN